MSTFKIVKLTDPIQFTNVAGGLVPKGAFNAGTSYSIGDSVSYTDGSSYVLYAAAVAGTLPTDTTKWQKLASKGDTGATGSTGATGATGSVSSASGITFIPTASPTYAAGKLVYDSDNESMTFYNNDSNVALQVGQEEWIRVKNVTGSTIANGSAIYINGASAGLPTIALAQSNAGATTICVGLTTESIANNAIGYVTCIGNVNGVDTSAFAAGATVYVSSTVAGGLVSTAPLAPNYRYRVGIVGTSSASVGTIHVTPSTASLGNGTANQLLGINSGGTAQEFKSTIQVRVTPRVTSITSSTTPTFNTDTTDCVDITALAAAITSMTSSVTGTPVNFDKLTIRIKDNGTARAITWGSLYEAAGSALPTTTVLSKRMIVGFIYDSTTAKWGCVAVANES